MTPPTVTNRPRRESNTSVFAMRADDTRSKCESSDHAGSGAPVEAAVAMRGADRRTIAESAVAASQPARVGTRSRSRRGCMQLDYRIVLEPPQELRPSRQPGVIRAIRRMHGARYTADA